MNTPQPQARTEAKQARLITSLLEGHTLEAAAKAVGVSYMQARRWQADPTFRQSLAEARRAAIGAALDVLTGSAREAAATVKALMADTTIPPGVRLKAACEVLDRLAQWVELSDLEDRITALEAVKDSDHGNQTP
jgi:hypothetical protein